MNYKDIFNKRFWRPYSCVQYKDDRIREALATLAKKFTNNLLYYITKDSEFYYINIMVPPFYNLQIYYYVLKLNNFDMYLYPEHFYIHRKNNFYYEFNKDNIFGQLAKSKYKNNKKIYLKSFDYMCNIQTSKNIYIINYTYNHNQIIIYNMENNISEIIYNYNTNIYDFSGLYYIFTYIDNYIYIYNKTISGGIHNKYIGNFRVIILFI